MRSPSKNSVSTASASNVLKSADTSAPWVAIVRRSCIGMPARPGPPNSRLRLAASPYSFGDVQEDVLAGDDGGFHALELIADRRGDLVPGRAGTHDRVDLGRTEPEIGRAH